MSCFCLYLLMLYGQRLKAARLYSGLTQAVLADRSGCKQTNVSKLELGLARGSDYTVQFALACGVSPAWLASEGNEPMTRPTLSGEDKAILKRFGIKTRFLIPEPQRGTLLSPDEEKLIGYYRTLSDAIQQTALSIVAVIVAHNK